MAGIPPTQAEVIRGAIRAALAEVMTATVGKVVLYNPLTQTADVLPVMKRPYNVGYGVVDYEDLPVIMNVPVKQPRAGGFFVHMPIEVGDHVLLVFTHDDIANWRETGASSEPDDLRRHSLGSCVALVGMADSTDPLSVVDPLEVAARLAGLVIGKDGSNAQIQWTADGFIQLGRVAPATPILSPVALSIPTDAAIAMLQAEIAAQAAALAALTTAVGAMVTAFGAHTHVVAAAPGTSAPPATPMTAPASPPAIGAGPPTTASLQTRST